MKIEEEILRLKIKVEQVIDYIERKLPSESDYWGLKDDIRDALKTANLLTDEEKD